MREDLISITKKLISFKTVSPAGNEVLCKKFITKILEESKFDVSVLAKSKNRPNIIGEVGKGARSLAIACHMDVVDAGSGWKTDPFKAVVKNGNIYGRGAIDDKGPFAIAYCAVKKFIKKYPAFDGKIYLIALADEEADNIYGIKYLLQKGFRADAALIPDGGYLNQLDIGEKGVIQLIIKSLGKQAHSALDEKGVNAITNLTHLIENLLSVKWPTKFDKRFSPVKINVSKFHGGEIANTIPPQARAQIDVRYPMGVSSDYVLKQVRKVIAATKGTFKTEIVYKTEPHLVKDKKLINTFLKASKQSKLKMKTITLAGNSVAKEFNEGGIPAITHYPMNKLPIHEPNEYIEISKMVKAANLYYEFLKIYFGVKQ